MNTMNRRHLIIISAGCALAGCDSTPSEPDNTDLLVVEAFLFAGEPIDDIRLTETVPLSDTAEAPSIDDAQVILTKHGLSYALEATGVDGYYQYTGADLTVEVGDTFGIEVAYLGAVATGETVVPAPPVNVSIDGDTMWVPAFGTGVGRPADFDRDRFQLAATWDNPDGLLHYVVIETLEDSAESIFPEWSQTYSRFRLITEPRTDDYHFINMMALRDLGRHVATVYRVNSEYARLYENRTQDSRDLNEPPSNIVGGLGVFSAFNSDSVVFEVVREGG